MLFYFDPFEEADYVMLRDIERDNMRLRVAYLANTNTVTILQEVRETGHMRNQRMELDVETTISLMPDLAPVLREISGGSNAR